LSDDSEKDFADATAELFMGERRRRLYTNSRPGDKSGEFARRKLDRAARRIVVDIVAVFRYNSRAFQSCERKSHSRPPNFSDPQHKVKRETVIPPLLMLSPEKRLDAFSRRSVSRNRS
jgi:hypothetical protein